MPKDPDPWVQRQCRHIQRPQFPLQAEDFGQHSKQRRHGIQWNGPAQRLIIARPGQTNPWATPLPQPSLPLRPVRLRRDQIRHPPRDARQFGPKRHLDRLAQAPHQILQHRWHPKNHLRPKRRNHRRIPTELDRIPQSLLRVQQDRPFGDRRLTLPSRHPGQVPADLPPVGLAAEFVLAPAAGEIPCLQQAHSIVEPGRGRIRHQPDRRLETGQRLVHPP